MPLRPFHSTWPRNIMPLPSLRQASGKRTDQHLLEGGLATGPYRAAPSPVEQGLHEMQDTGHPSCTGPVERGFIPVIVLALSLMAASMGLHAQDGHSIPDRARFEEPGTLVWLGTYSTIRLGERVYYEAQHHYRRSNHDGTPWVGRMAQIYNRHAITYRFSDRFIFTVGPVLRLNFTPDPGNPEYENLTLEPRIWHEYAFPMRGFLGARNFVLQHRIRIEHRWNRNNLVGADWVYRDRWRYRLLLKLPLNKRSFQPGTLYMDVINAEIIMQSGKTVVDAPLEDLRIYPSLGYIFSTKVAVSSGMMYTLGQRVGRGYDYRQRWVFRLNLWWTPDFRKLESRIPATKVFD